MSKYFYRGFIVFLCLVDLGLSGIIFRNFQTSVPISVIQMGVKNTFSALKPETKNRKPTIQSLQLRAVGDVMLGRSVALQSKKHGNWQWPFMDMVPRLSPVDIFIGNLEAPIVTDCPLQSEGMIFCAPTQVMGGLAYAGFDLVSLANNHSLNQGMDGLAETEYLLSKADITSLRHAKTVVIHRNGIPLGFGAYDDISQPVSEAGIRASTQPIATQSAVQIALIHWGTEYQATPSARQRLVASWLADAGMDIILGTHPHVVQPIEQTNGKVIAYSLGNFVFDQMWSRETRKGVVLDMELQFDNGRLVFIKPTTTPIVIYDYGQPRLE